MATSRQQLEKRIFDFRQKAQIQRNTIKSLLDAGQTIDNQTFQRWNHLVDMLNIHNQPVDLEE